MGWFIELLGLLAMERSAKVRQVLGESCKVCISSWQLIVLGVQLIPPRLNLGLGGLHLSSTVFSAVSPFLAPSSPEVGIFYHVLYITNGLNKET